MSERVTMAKVAMVVVDLFKESIIVQSLLTLVIIVVTGYKVATGDADALPEQWWQITALIVGYWVGSKGNFQSVQANKRTMESMEKMADSFTIMTTAQRGCNCDS